MQNILNKIKEFSKTIDDDDLHLEIYCDGSGALLGIDNDEHETFETIGELLEIIEPTP